MGRLTLVPALAELDCDYFSRHLVSVAVLDYALVVRRRDKRPKGQSHWSHVSFFGRNTSTCTANDDSRLETDDGGNEHHGAIVPFASSAHPYEVQALC